MKIVDILMIDDSEADLELARSSLYRDKIANIIYTAKTEDEARDILSEKKIDLVIIDINLSVGSGLDFISEAKKDGLITDQPVVVLSGVSDHGMSKRAADIGVSLWAKKPLDRAQIDFMVDYIPELYTAIVKSA